MVLQRWQSVYLFIADVALGLSLFMPVFDIESQLDGGMKTLSLCSLSQGAAAVGLEASSYAYFILIAVSAVMSLITIFKFKNLKLQKTLCSVTMLLIIVAYIVVALCGNLLIEDAVLHWDLASLIPAFALICVFLAKGRVMHDYRLIHEADRLR